MEKPVKINAKYKGNGWSAQKLECIYANRKLTILGPLVLAAAVLLLFLIFGENPDKLILVRDSLVLAALMYAAVLLLVGTELFNSRCSPRAMDNYMLFFTACMIFGVVQQMILFLLHLRDGFNIGLPGFCTCLSALALIQSRRI